ncbi:TonB-dependent receptor [Gluconacetobacter tumulicola]|uniref:TonB-dependent receptor n=2 Tax=Gluconacetobacter tumulicola TaxID=1017177 RepID=A0A7W4JDT6_9PROT|nr:TonB-dependent receptor [Gluconacetobacter tumulicola]MBB2179420.1 TonB-dependent receptor [Gluconacetobacter tumulicola]
MPRSFSRRSAWPRRAGRFSQSARVLLGPSALALMQAGPLAASAWADDSHARRAADHAPHAAPARKTAPAATPVAAAAPVKGEDIVVATHRLSPADQARAQLDSLPGAATVIDAKQVLRGRNLTNADALAFQPGVFAQSSGGGDGLRLSIRGSGIQVGTNYFRSGLLMMFDGLPVTTPAGTPYELFEPLGLRYTEVLRGANAFDYGGLQLGGGINYVTQTGYDAQTYQARVEAGSFGYNKEQLSSGKVIGKADYYISVTNSYRGGYQTETQANSFGVNANFGYRFNDRVSTRFFFRYRQTRNGYPGYLTRDQILENPKQAQAPYRAWHSVRIQPGSKFYGNMTTIRIDDRSKLELGFDYQDAPIDIQNTSFSQIWGYKTVAATLNYTRHDVLAGHKSDTQLGFMDTSDLEAWQTNRVRVATGHLAGLPMGQVLRHVTYGGTENYFHLRNNTELFHDFWLTTAAAVAFIQKSSGVPYPYTAAGANFKESSVNFVPRGGFRYVISPHVELYGNVSRSIQPPNDWNLNYAGPYFTGNIPQAGMNSGAGKLRNQTATTYEIGTTGHAWRNKWSLTYYHSDVRNELLSVMTPASQAIGASIYGNASPTTHQGVEASLETTLYAWAGNTLSLRQAYTWQDFRFRHDAVFGSNRLPGIPEHFYQGEIHLDTKAGFYAGFNAQVSSKVGAAYDETYFAPSYHIYNLNIGYEWPGKHRQVFLSVNNLANTHYAAIVVPGYIAAGKQLAVMQPGDGLGVFAGLSLGFN